MSESLNDQIAKLERQLSAKNKTLDVLIEKARKDQVTSASAFQTLATNTALTQIVEKKTRELEERNRDLEEAHSALSMTQAKLLQAQKLESIGRLASGVAHEINTPVQFVGDSIHFISEAMNDLFGLIDAMLNLSMQVASGSVPICEVEDNVNAIKEKFDYDYLLDNVPKSTERAVDGLSRVSEIVQSMKAFGHPGQKTMTLSDINQCLTTTLAVAKSAYKYVAEIEVELGELPMVECMGGELNQVFLNLIVNAAHAIEDANKSTGNLGVIAIQTRLHGHFVIVEVTDTGCGIPESIHGKVFDPFFTTKEVGKGTGQGLSLAHQVICQVHGGDITFVTSPGEGTTFIIKLPISQANRIKTDVPKAA